LALLQLAPDVQERVLFLEGVDGVEPLTERDLRPIVRVSSWPDQRSMVQSTGVDALRTSML